MECFSKKFTLLVRELIDSDKMLIATIALKGAGLIAELKQREDVQMFELTSENRDRLALEISKTIMA
jgi:nucleoside-triphosphatase